MIVLKKPSEVETMRRAGRIVARTIRELAESIVPGKTSARDLNELGERIIADAGGVPSFKGYRGYPAAVCVSRNEVVIHGIPDDVPLEEGDIVDIDVGVCLEGYHADAARTFPVGAISKESARLLAVTKESLNQGLAKAKVGNRIGDIAFTIQKYVESNGFSVVRDLVGHGIGRSLHEEPSVPNYGTLGKGEMLREGMTICIEPMVNEGTWKVVTLPDKWTMITADGKRSAHFEHTVHISRNGPDILTVE
ncbi:MAG: type I methionyl aminopeptidase [Fimbriimonadaceae bacterium]|nr:type I methionyl aminopeptidase [Fimbriimonadaceae bacterium]